MLAITGKVLGYGLAAGAGLAVFLFVVGIGWAITVRCVEKVLYKR